MSVFVGEVGGGGGFVQVIEPFVEGMGSVKRVLEDIFVVGFELVKGWR